ncbi:hypothetical protein SK128_005326, partial [Halocaridina rubra]
SEDTLIAEIQNSPRRRGEQLSWYATRIETLTGSVSEIADIPYMRQSIVRNALRKIVPEKCHFLLKSNTPVPELVRLLLKWFESHPGHGLSEEEVERERLTRPTASPVAAMTNERGPRFRDAQAGWCARCGGTGHSQDWCVTTAPPDVVCYNCRGAGHRFRGCPSPRITREVGQPAFWKKKKNADAPTGTPSERPEHLRSRSYRSSRTRSSGHHETTSSAQISTCSFYLMSNGILLVEIAVGGIRQVALLDTGSAVSLIDRSIVADPLTKLDTP